MTTIRFQNDTRLRKRLMVPESFRHPAKLHLGLQQELVERYSKPGDWLLDPMAGVGSLLIAALMGRNVICVELEAHFVEPMRASWEQMRMHPMLGYELGQVEIHQGNARDLSWLWPVDTIVTSPPWEDRTAMQDMGWIREHDPEIPLHTGTQEFQKTHNRKTLEGYTRLDTIVTSPSFQDNSATSDKGIAVGKGLDFGGYSQNPPYNQIGTVEAAQERGRAIGTNIGNLRDAAYWEAMTAVYRECYRVLKPGGILCLVLKGFTRDGKYVDLPEETSRLVETLGFQKFDEWRRQLWTLSFWRILQKRRNPGAFDDRLNYEEVLAFKKPDGEGGGVDMALTSPPYENQIHPNSDTPDSVEVIPWADPKKVGKSPHSQFRAVEGYGRPDAILTSPPYEGSLTEGQDGIDYTAFDGGKRDKTKEAQTFASSAYRGYTRKPERSVCHWRGCSCELEHEVLT